jgi:hypothetical protein
LVKNKIDDFFLRHSLAEYDSNAAEVLNSLTSRYELISAKDLPANMDEIAMLPIAKLDSKKNMPLDEGINPYWKNAIFNLKNQVCTPLFQNKSSLSAEEWQIITQKFTEYQQWLSEKSGTVVEKLGLNRIREILELNNKLELLLLIEKDKEIESEANSIIEVDKLVRLYRDLYRLLKNFVNFSDFYSSSSKAIFQAGKLYIDQRCCELCIKVNNIAKHNSFAGSSGICLLYCDCFSKTKNEKMTIVAALTDGDIDNIRVGRNAIFYDQDGEDWDATIINIIENPISIRQAFWSPYKKVSKFISTQVEKLAASKEQEVQAVTTSGIEKGTAKVDTHITETMKSKPITSDPTIIPATPTVAPPVQDKPPFDIGKFVGIFAALSLALGAIGSVIATTISGFLNLRWWEMPLALLGVILTISLPSMVIAYLKLRKRNLAPVLDANGWAVNARLTINIIFGRTLTHLASLPINSKVNLIDPFSKKKNPTGYIIAVLVVIASIIAFILWHYGIIQKWKIF